MVVSRLRPSSTAQTLQPPPPDARRRRGSAGFRRPGWPRLAVQRRRRVRGNRSGGRPAHPMLRGWAGAGSRVRVSRGSPCRRPRPGGLAANAGARHARTRGRPAGARVRMAPRHPVSQVHLRRARWRCAGRRHVRFGGHHVGAGRRYRQYFEQGGKSLLRIRADGNLGPGALHDAWLRAWPLSVQQIARALEGGRANVECQKPARGHRCRQFMFMGTVPPGATAAH